MLPSILIAEDDDPCRAMLGQRFQRLGYKVFEAADGAEAVALTLNHAPDVLILDLTLPRMDGIEAWRLICDLAPTPPTAIALTATAILDLQLQCSEMGIFAYLTKPCSFDALHAAVRDATVQERALAG
ncbi:MAG: response regulator [Hyphomonadaceae bacterium]|nr:response regulator [Hyphomonadaceae bacterium]